MRSRASPSGRGFATATGTALGVLVGWNLAYRVSAGLLVGGFGRPGQLVYQLPGWIGLLLVVPPSGVASPEGNGVMGSRNACITHAVVSSDESVEL
jgi:hypothetical protein